MSVAVDGLRLREWTDGDGPVDDEIQAQVWDVLAGLYPQREVFERREENRYPYPYLIHLTPVGKDGLTPEGEPVVAVGKHLSNRGMGFYHPRPLPYRRMIVSLEAVDGSYLAFLVDLAWCRFTRQGWYESGGRFLQAVDSPLAIED